MPPLPVVSGDEAVRRFERVGWVFKRQSGSHMVLSKSGHPRRLSVPRHRELDKGSLKGLIRKAGMTVQEFIDAE